MRPPVWWHDAAVWLSLGAYFLVLELLAVFWDRCPWQTLTATDRRFIAWWHFALVLLAFAFLALALHRLARLPVDWLIVAAASVALGALAKLAWELLS